MLCLMLISDEIAQMVQRQTKEMEAPESTPALVNYFAPFCSVSQAIGCIKSLPNRRTTKYQCTSCDNADDKSPMTL